MERVVVNKPRPLSPEAKEELLRVQLAFGKRLRQLRHEKLMTLEQVAELADIHANYLSAVERGKRNVSLFNVWRIASSLNLSAADLMGDLPVRKVHHLVMEPKQNS